MWRPREIVRHALPLATSPTADEAARSLLFSPIELASGLRLEARTWVPAMVPWRATDDGFVTRDVLDWYGRFAEGEPAAIVVEATGIRDVPSGPLLRAGDDRFIPGLAELARVVRERSGGRTRLFLQLIDFLRVRRRPDPGRYFGQFLKITDEHARRLGVAGAPEAEVRRALAALDDAGLADALTSRELEALRMGERERVTDVGEPAIRDLPRVLPDLFAAAAARVEAAGFDGVELHYAHAYTMSSLLSALNTRADGYGGPREQRVRLPLEVFERVRARVSRGFTVGARFLCDDIVEGGSRVDDAAYFATRFALAGMDFLSLSTGGRFEDAEQPKVGEAAYPYTGESGHACMPTTVSDARGPFARNVPKQAIVRAAVRAAGCPTPVVVAGGIATFDLAEGILARGEGDIIAAARQSLADPDWWRKLRVGRGVEVRRCIYRNYCEALDQKHKQVTCQLWDRELTDAADVTLSADGRRRLIAPPWRM